MTSLRLQISQEGSGEENADSDYEPAGHVTIDSDTNPLASVMQAALSCQRELDHADRFTSADHAADSYEGIEALRLSIESLDHAGEWNEHTQALTRLALEGYIHASGLGTVQQVLAPTYALAGAQVPAQVALEALDDILAVMSDHVQAGFGKLKQSVLASLGNLAASLPTMENKWRAMEQRLHNEASDHHGEVDAGGLVKRLHRQGKFPDDLESYLKEYASYVEVVATEFDHHAQAAVVKNADLLAHIEFESAETFAHTYEASSRSWDDPRQSLPAGIFDFIVPGSEPFFTNLSTTYKGDNKAIQHFDLYATKHVPTKGRWGLAFRTIDKVEKIEPLSLSAMRDLCKHFLDVTEKVKLLGRGQGEALAHAQIKAEYFAKRKADADSDVKKASREAYRYLDRAYGVTFELGEHFKYDTLSHFMGVSKALLTYMQRSLNPTQPKAVQPPQDHSYND